MSRSVQFGLSSPRKRGSSGLKGIPVSAGMKSFLFLLISFAVAAHAQGGKPEQEPDYAFFTNSPYTETKNSAQIILSDYFSTDYGDTDNTRVLQNSLRVEWGFTDYLELDVIVGYDGQWTQSMGQTNSQGGFADTTLGIRYRFLREGENFPLTVAFGPQAVFPTGDETLGFGTGGYGLGWDLTLARDWNRWFFNYAEINYVTTFGASKAASSSGDDILNDIAWGVAPAFRFLEKNSKKENHHCLHFYTEFAGTFGESFAQGTNLGSGVTTATYLLSPGIRYGFLTPKKTLFEAGVAIPMGLNEAAPDWGLFLQLQFEKVF